MDIFTPSIKRYAVAGTLVSIIAITWLSRIDFLALQQVDAGLNRALVTFGVAKALDAAISVIQSAQFSFNAGVGFALTVGEILDPLNDLVEQFSSFILAAAVAFGIQKILLAIGGYSVVKVMLSVISAIWACLVLAKQKMPKALVYLWVFILMARFAVPLVTIVGNFLFENFMISQYQVSETGIKAAIADLNTLLPDQLIPQPSQQPQGFWDKIKPSLPSLPNTAELKAMIDEFKQKVDVVTQKVIGHFVNLLVVFILQTLIFPVVMLWLLYQAVLSMLSGMSGNYGSHRE